MIIFIDFKAIKYNESPQIYKYIETIYNRGGRGGYYQLKVKFNQKDYVVNVTEKVSFDIKQKKYPDLYFSKKHNTLFSLWDIKRNFRISIIFLSMSIIAFIPMKRIIQFALFVKIKIRGT